MTAETLPPTDRLETIIDAYLEDYETTYDEGSVQPDDQTRYVIKDAIMGLLVDDDWDAEWGRHIAALAAERQAAQPVAWLDEFGNTFPLAAWAKSEVKAKWRPLYASHHPAQPLTDAKCDDAIRAVGLWQWACAMPQNLALLRGLCHEVGERLVRGANS